MEATKRMTRASLVSEVPSLRKSRQKKKAKTDKPSKVNASLKNASVASDEGIDVTFSPSQPSTLSIPSTIIRPQHPLPHSWTFWYSAGNKRLSWKQNQVKISAVSTIEDFWLVYNQIKVASMLPIGYTYSVFRGDIVPDWEDDANKDGGRWMVSWDKADRQEKLDERWLEVLFMLMGEHIEKKHARHVTGAELCVRKKLDRIEVWVGDGRNMAGTVEVGRVVKKKMGVDSNDKIKFSIHKEEREGINGPVLML